MGLSPSRWRVYRCLQVPENSFQHANNPHPNLPGTGDLSAEAFPVLCSTLLWVCRGWVPLISQPALLLTHRQGSTRSQEPCPKADISQNSFPGWFQLWCSASHLVETCRAHGQLQQLRCEPSLTMSVFPLAGADRRNYIWGKNKE